MDAVSRASLFLLCRRKVHVPKTSRAAVDGGCLARGAAQLQGVAHPPCGRSLLLIQCKTESHDEPRLRDKEVEACGDLGWYSDCLC